MSRLAFSERGHVYSLDGKRVPSVSRIAGAPNKAAMPYAAAREAALWASAHRDAYDVMGDAAWLKSATEAHRIEWNQRADDGRLLHVLAEALVYGHILPSDHDGKPVPDHVADMAEQLARFYDAHRVEPVAHERMVWHERYRYAGRFDLLARLGSDGRRWLLDYKTGASGVWPETSLQLTGYRYATHYVDPENVDRSLDELAIEETGAVWLRPDSWELLPVRSDVKVWDIFRHCGAVAQWLDWKREDSIYDPLPRPETVAP